MELLKKTIGENKVSKEIFMNKAEEMLVVIANGIKGEGEGQLAAKGNNEEMLFIKDHSPFLMLNFKNPKAVQITIIEWNQTETASEEDSNDIMQAIILPLQKRVEEEKTESASNPGALLTAMLSAPVVMEMARRDGKNWSALTQEEIKSYMDKLMDKLMD